MKKFKIENIARVSDVIRHGSITCLHDNEGKFGTITAFNVKVDVLVDGDEYKAGIYNRENGTFELVNLTKASGKRLYDLSRSRNGMENLETFIEHSVNVSSNLEFVFKEVDESLFTNLTASNGMTFIPASEVEDSMINHGRSSRLQRDTIEEIWNCVAEVLGTRINPSVSTEEFLEGLTETASQQSQPETPQSVRERVQQIVQSEAQRREALLGNSRGDWQGGQEQGRSTWYREAFNSYRSLLDTPPSTASVLPSSSGLTQSDGLAARSLEDWIVSR